ncbi:MAG: YdcF family protein [Kofleriaceae bacterium]
MIWNALASLLEAPLRARARAETITPIARDAIVVLGAPLGPRDSLTPVLAERVTAAAALWQQGGAPVIVATGGVTHGARLAEADVIADALRAAGVADPVVERASLTTLDNARKTAELLLPAKRSVWLITQPFHMRRAERLFRGAGFDAHAWPIRDSLEYQDRRRAVKWLFREYASWGKLLSRRSP